MPPPKKTPSGGKKNKKGNESDVDGMEMNAEQKLSHMKTQLCAMEFQLAHRSEIVDTVKGESSALRELIKKAEDETREERTKTSEILKDMTRQYKGMREELMNRINSLEQTLQSTKDARESEKKAYRRDLIAKEEIIVKKNFVIESLQTKFDDTTLKFSQMLTNISRQLNEKVELNSLYCSDQTTPVHERMEELRRNISFFSLHSGSK